MLGNMSIPSLKINETDDEFFGTLEGRSNLANLFGVNQQADDVYQSLKYKPPKQVQGPTDEHSPMAWSVQVAKVVTAFKLINQENVPQGRVGLALLKTSQNDFKIIVYRTKSNVLATTTLRSTSKLILKSSYLQFHDDSQEFWSIFLETSDEKSFTDHVPLDFLSTIEEPNEKPVITDETHPEPSSDDSGTTSKAKLLSRMARMGQPLPKLATPPTATDMSDSSDTEVIKIPPKPSIVPRKVSKQLVPVGNSLQSTSVSAYTQVQENQYMNMLLTENRTQNTELRINLSKLETKIERVLDKMDSISSREPPPAAGRDKDDEIVGLEEKILELRKENRALRQNCRELEAKVAHPVREKSKLKAEMFSGFESVIEKLGVHLEDCTDLEDVTLELLEKSKSRLDGLRDECIAKDKELVSSKAELESLKLEQFTLKNALKDTEDLRSKVEMLSHENQDLKSQQDLDKTHSNDKLKTIVKQIMNNLYGDIAASLETTNDALTTDIVLRICGSAIRKETINAIQGNSN